MTNGSRSHLRCETETVPLAALGTVLARALELGDRLCLDSLGCGDASTFSGQAAVCADLREFGICARLFEEAVEFD